MNLKRIDLFQLMNAFQDEEFEPEEECFVNENKVKETVLTQVRQKKRKGRKVLVLAAALAACLALIGWTYGEKIYPLLTTVDAAIGNGSETVYISAGSYENGGNGIIELEEGRLWFLVEGQRLDITDQVDEKTPYVWTRWERNGDLHYVLVGGTPEDYGWAEGIKFANGEGGGTGTLHSREDIPWEEFIQDPDWYGVGLSQVEELWESQNG